MRRAGATSGFTLLEVMIAVAILAATLVVLLRIVTNNIRATNHAKMTTAATFLARTKMSDVEDDVLYNGFSSDTESDKGNFKDEGKGYERFSWTTLIERIELPTDLTQKTQDSATKASQDAKNPMEMMSSFFGGMMSAFIEPIRIGLQESVRKVTVRVVWDESGRPDQTIEVVEYLTDPAQLEKAMGMPPGGGQTPPPGGQAQGNKTGPTTGQAAGGIQQRSPFPGFTGFTGGPK